jgi:SPP1 family phage portal protein
MFYTPSDNFRPDDKWNIIDNKQGYAIQNKKPYIVKKIGDSKDRIDNTETMEGQNYPTFPIVPFWGNEVRQSELVGLREQIDCYDLIKSGFANSIDEASFITWIVKNAGGMDDVDLQKFIEQIKTIHATDLPEGVEVTPTTLDAPFNGREVLLERIDKDLYRDAMAFDPQQIANGAVTATQIRAAYEPLNSKVDSYEYCVLEFIQGILQVAGIEDEATFTRSKIVNVNEDIQTILQASANLPDDYVTTKILTLLGDGDKAEEMVKQMQADELKRFSDDTEPSEAE